MLPRRSTEDMAVRMTNHTDHEANSRTRSESANRHSMLLLEGGLIVGLCCYFASMAPGVLVAATLSSLLFMAGFLVGSVALMRGEPLGLRAFNYWDLAFACIALATVSGWLVDPEAIRAYALAHGLIDVPAGTGGN